MALPLLVLLRGSLRLIINFAHDHGTVFTALSVLMAFGGQAQFAASSLSIAQLARNCAAQEWAKILSAIRDGFVPMSALRSIWPVEHWHTHSFACRLPATRLSLSACWF